MGILDGKLKMVMFKDPDLISFYGYAKTASIYKATIYENNLHENKNNNIPETSRKDLLQLKI